MDSIEFLALEDHLATEKDKMAVSQNEENSLKLQVLYHSWIIPVGL